MKNQYSGLQAIRVKSIDNWFSKHKMNPDNWNSFRNSLPETGRPGNPLRYDEQFIETCKSIPYSPKYQYQLLQLILQVEEK